MCVALATCKAIPEPDADENVLLRKLEDAGASAAVLAWDDPSAPFADYDLVVIRSTWNYYKHLDAFLAWVTRTAAATRLVNPAPIVRWNAVKTYLRDLEARGIAIVPTIFVERGARCSLKDELAARGFVDFVIKPTVSAGSYRTQRFTLDQVDDAQRFLDELANDRDAMVQRFMPSVDTYGERSIIWINGVITHAIRKTPRFADGNEQVSGEMPVAADERAFAEEVLAPYAADLLYARVDMVRDDDGSLRVMEVELIEPSLFLLQCPRALDRFVAAILGAKDAGG